MDIDNHLEILIGLYTYGIALSAALLSWREIWDVKCCSNWLETNQIERVKPLITYWNGIQENLKRRKYQHPHCTPVNAVPVKGQMKVVSQ